MKISILRLITSMLCFMVSWQAHASSDIDWIHFKAKFLMQDGRVLDTGNGSVSHSEGQGYGMLFAVAANDKQSFQRIWNWTKQSLQNPQSQLFYWKFNPILSEPLEDKNNETDGDILIAWALLKAGKKWGGTYTEESEQIFQAVMNHTVIDFAGKKVLLPGAHGFRFDDYVYLNPSYFIFPAWKDFYAHTGSAELKALIEDSETLLSKQYWSSPYLATDWVMLSKEGRLKPANKWPARVSYDAIRIPLYLKWYQPKSRLLTPWAQWFENFSRLNTPAWLDIEKGQTADYMMRGGLLSVRDLTLNSLSPAQAKINNHDDYYSACLKLLAVLAQDQF